MGLFRGVLLVFVSILLLISLMGLNSLFVLSSSLEYENVHSQINAIVTNESVLDEFFPDTQEIFLSEKDELFKQAKSFCKKNGDYVFHYEEYDVNVSCGQIQKFNSSEPFLDEVVNEFVRRIYFKEYECSYWKCFAEETPLVFLSEKSYDYWKGKFYISVFVSLAFIVLIFFLVEQKQNFPIILGALMIIAVLPLTKLESLLVSVAGSFSIFFQEILVSMKSVYWISIVMGVILVSLGLSWRFWAPESLKKKFSREDIRKIAKGEK